MGLMDREIADSLETRINDKTCNVFEYDLKYSKRISNLNFKGHFYSLLFFLPTPLGAVLRSLRRTAY